MKIFHSFTLFVLIFAINCFASESAPDSPKLNVTTISEKEFNATAVIYPNGTLIFDNKIFLLEETAPKPWYSEKDAGRVWGTLD